VESYQPVQELSSTNPLEHIHTPTPPEQIVPSSAPTQSPSLRHSPPTRPKSSKRPRSSTRDASSLNRSRSKLRTPSPVRTNSTPPLPAKQEEPKGKHDCHYNTQDLLLTSIDITRKPSFFPLSSKKSTPESTKSPSPVIIENEQQTGQHRPVSRVKSGRRKKSASSKAKSPKSVVLTNFDDQSVAIVENAYVKGELLRPALKRPKSLKKTRFQDEIVCLQ